MLFDNNNQIGAKIKELREKKGVTQQDLAKEFGVRREVVSMWESGERDIKTANTIRLAEFFNVSCDYLLRGIEANNLDVHRETGLSEQTIRLLKKYMAVSTKDNNVYDTKYFNAIKGLNEIFETEKPYEFFLLAHYYLTGVFKEPIPIERNKVHFKDHEDGKFIFGDYKLQPQKLDRLFLDEMKDYLIRSRENLESE